MAKIPLSEVPAPVDLRDTILEDYEAYKSARGAGVPDKLFSTFWAAKNTGVPSHDAGKAIDIVTDSYASRPYLFEFGAELFGKRKDLSVYWYPQTYEPHVHVGQVSGFGKGSYLAISKGKAGQFWIFPREQVSGKVDSIIDLMKKQRETYPAGVEVDWDHVRESLTGNFESPASNILQKFKKYWWVAVLPIVLVVLIFIIKKVKERREDYGT